MPEVRFLGRTVAEISGMKYYVVEGRTGTGVTIGFI